MPPISPPPSTYGTQLAGEILGVPLNEWVQERRNAGKSWDAVAVDLALTTEGRVTYTREHLRRLYSLPAPANGDAA